MKTACALLVVALITIQAAAQIPRSRQAPTQPAASTETYESVDIDADGNLRILTSEHRTVIVPKGGSPKAGESVGKQTAFGKPVLSDDRRAVASERLVATADIPEVCGQIPDPPKVKVPKWVTGTVSGFN